LLSEAHLTHKYNFKVNGYTFYGTDYPNGKAHGGGILIRDGIKHHFHFAATYMQASSFKVHAGSGNLIIAAVYRPSCITISVEQFMNFYNLLGDRFITAVTVPNTRTGDIQRSH